MKNSLTQSFYVTLQFFRRDFHVHMKNFPTHAFNYSLIYPFLYTFCFAFLQTKILLQGQERIGAIAFAGTCLLPTLIITFHTSFELLFDLEHNCHIDYQVTVLNPRLVIIEQILFSSFFTFLIIVPYFPIAYFFSRSFIDLSNIHWPSLFVMLYMGALCCASYNKLAVMFLSVHKISTFWARINNVLQGLGGFWIPLYVVHTFSPTLSCLVRLNPIMYMTEGIRQSLVGGHDFLPLWQCATTLLLMTVMFTLLTFHFFKKRIDHI